MKLYTNGCSFTQGSIPFEKLEHTQVYNDYEYTTCYDSTLWPWQLRDNFEFVFNHARYGTGADRLLRTTIDFLSKLEDTELHDWIFVLQVSKPAQMSQNNCVFRLAKPSELTFFSNFFIILIWIFVTE